MLLISQPTHHRCSHNGWPWRAGRPLFQTSLTICFGRQRFRNGTNQAPIAQPVPQRR